MSRHTVPALAPAGRHGITELVAGWDRPLQQWFAIGKREGETVWEWSGSSLDRLNEAADEIGLRLPISLLQRLQEDGQQNAGNTITQFPVLNLEKQPGFVVQFNSAGVREVIDHALDAKDWQPTLLMEREGGRHLYSKPQPGVVVTVDREGIRFCSNAKVHPEEMFQMGTIFALGYDPAMGSLAGVPGSLELPIEHTLLQPRLDELRRAALRKPLVSLAISAEDVEVVW